MTITPLIVDVHHRLDRFDLKVEFTTTHRVTGIFGVSGSGKTTLLETIAGLRRRATGRIALGDELWLDTATKHRLPSECRGVGYVPQESLLFPHRTVMGNLRSGEKRALKEGIDFQQRLERVVRVLDIASLLDRPVTTLSGGERQRVALARAICSGPKLLLLDEPLASLDIGLRRRVLPFLHRVQSEFALPMLMVSHNPVEMQAICDDLIVLRDGRIIARGEPRSVLTRPDVFPIAESEGFENVLRARVVEVRSTTAVARLGEEGTGPMLIVSGTRLSTGSTIMVSIPASEILLAVERLTGVSARNILAARVSDIQSVGTLCLITIRIADDVPPLVAEVTADAIEELHIEREMELHLIIKTSAITVYEEGE